MQVKIIETNEIKDLTAKSWSSTTSWTDWTADLLGEWDALQRDEGGMALLSEYDFKWWNDIVGRINIISYAKKTDKWQNFLELHTFGPAGYDDVLREFFDIGKEGGLQYIVDDEVDWLVSHGIVNAVDVPPSFRDEPFPLGLKS